MKIKGLVLLARREFVKEHFGEEAWEKVVKALPAQDQQELNYILATKWYSFETGKRLDRAVVNVLGKGKIGFFEEIGAESARRSLTKEHKLFLTPGDPQAFMKKASTIYKFYYDTGYRTYQQTGPHSGVMTTFEAETFSAPDCLTVIGWYKEALKLCGAKRVQVVEEECRARGDSCCRYRLQWEI